jgi:hypothetical protein
LIVVFEGLPGCGKSTIAREAVKRLDNTVLMPEVSEMAASRGFEVADRASIGTETWFLTQYYTRGHEADGRGFRGGYEGPQGPVGKPFIPVLECLISIQLSRVNFKIS